MSKPTTHGRLDTGPISALATLSRLGRRPKATTAPSEKRSIGFPQFLAQNLAKRSLRDRPLDTLSPLRWRRRRTQDSIDLRLISDTFRLGALAKMLDDVVVQHDRNARLPGGGNNSAALAFRKIVVFTHGNAPSRHDWPCA